MPLGNLTSHFFANVYLNELDYFIKFTLRAQYYIRYVDDFVVLSRNKLSLENYKEQINEFLHAKLNLQLHPTKSKIIPLSHGINFLGFRIFWYHKLLRKSNLWRFKKKPSILKAQFDKNDITYDNVCDSMLGSIAYARNANTYALRKNLEKQYDHLFKNQISTVEINKHVNLILSRDIWLHEGAFFEYCPIVVKDDYFNH